MKNLKTLRLSANYTQQDLALMLGVKPKNISDWELGKSQPELRILRDIAVIFGTSVYDILSDNLVTTTYWKPWNKDKSIDTFWGHIGILLYNSNFIKWYPITTQTANIVENDLIELDSEAKNQILTVTTLNNRLLYINKKIIKKISLLDDSSDIPKDWEIPWDGYQGLGAEEFYNLIEEYFSDHVEFRINTSENLQKIIEKIIKDNRLTDENIDEITNNIYIYFHDNTTETLFVDDILEFLDSISDVIILENKFIRCTDINGEIHFFPIDSIGLIDTPLYQFKKEVKKIEFFKE